MLDLSPNSSLVIIRKETCEHFISMDQVASPERLFLSLIPRVRNNGFHQHPDFVLDAPQLDPCGRHVDSLGNFCTDFLGPVFSGPRSCEFE